MMPQQSGPTGCKSKEECDNYCQTNPDACKNMQPGSGQSSGQMPSPEMMQKMMEMMQQGQQPPEGMQPPPNGDFGPPEGQQPPPPPTSFWLNPNSIVASAITALINLFTK
jgi:hypothetical protein